MFTYEMFIGTLVVVGLAIYVMYLVAKFKAKKPGKKGEKAYKLKEKLETVGALYFFAAFGFAAVCVLAEWSDTPEIIKTEVVETLTVTDFVTFVDKDDEPLHYVVVLEKDGVKTMKSFDLDESTLECNDNEVSICEVVKVTEKKTGIVYQNTHTTTKYTFK